MPTTKTVETSLRCPTCGSVHPPKKGGVILRVKAGDARMRVLGRCTVCDQMKFLISEPAGGPGGKVAADREVTLMELAAYVSESTMSIETAEAIAGAESPEARKRHVAALVAEGVLKPEDAVRLLAM